MRQGWTQLLHPAAAGRPGTHPHLQELKVQGCMTCTVLAGVLRRVLGEADATVVVGGQQRGSLGMGVVGTGVGFVGAW